MNLLFNSPSPGLIAFICAKGKVKAEKPPRLNLKQAQDFSNDDVRDMLACLPVPDDYDEWLEEGMALKDGGYPFELWDEHSRQSSKYDAAEMRRKWESFKGSGITMGTLFYKARECGWSPSCQKAAYSPPAIIRARTEGLKRKYEAFNLGEILGDMSPMPDDLIGPRVLTPSGLLLFAGAPKVGKSDFILSLLVHAAAGLDFLGLSIAKPMQIFYLQAEIQKPYLRERLKNMDLPPDVIERASKNLVITPQMKIVLNDEGMEIAFDLIQRKFGEKKPDIIVIDPIRNVFDGGPSDSGLGENDNQAMMFFLQNRVEPLRDAINPDAGIILFTIPRS